MKNETIKKLKNYAIWILGGSVIIMFVVPRFLPANPLLEAIFIFVSIPLTMLLVFAAILFLFIYAFSQGGIRSSEMEKLAAKIGWNYQKDARLEFLRSDAERLQLGEYLSYHPLKGETHNLLSGRIHNIDGVIEYGEVSAEDKKDHRGPIQSFDALIFDQTIHLDAWEHGLKLESLTSGNTRHGTKSKSQTMFLVKLPDADLPPFCIEPEGFWNKLHDIVDNRDFDFPDFPVFSHKYKFFGEFSEEEIRRIFDQDVIRFYERADASFITIGHRDRLLIYYPEQIIPVEAIGEQMIFLMKLANCFQSETKPLAVSHT